MGGGGGCGDQGEGTIERASSLWALVSIARESKTDRAGGAVTLVGPKKKRAISRLGMRTDHCRINRAYPDRAGYSRGQKQHGNASISHDVRHDVIIYGAIFEIFFFAPLKLIRVCIVEMH